MTIRRGGWLGCVLAGAALVSCLNPLPEDFPSDHGRENDSAGLGEPGSDGFGSEPSPGSAAGAPPALPNDSAEAPSGAESEAPADAGSPADAGAPEADR